MNATSDLERRLATWLEREGPDRVPERVIEAALSEADTIRQRPAWLTSTWWSFRPAGGATTAPPSGLAGRVAGRSLRLGWVVLAVALLLALAGLLAVGALRDRAAPLVSGCAAGTTPDVPGPAGQPEPSTIQTAVWDPTGGGAVLVFADDGTFRTTWRFDTCTNTWHRVEHAAAPFRLTDPWSGVALAYDVDSARVLVVQDQAVWAFDPHRGRWTAAGEPPFEPPFDRRYALDAAYDPVTGLVVVFDGSRMRTFDVDAGAWRDVDVEASGPARSGGGWHAGSLAYDAAADRFVLVLYGYGSVVGSTWEFDLRTRTWTHRSGDESDLTVGRLTRSDFLVYDELNERILAFGTRGVAAYDRAAGGWQVLEEAGSYDWHWAAKAFDPLNGRVVAFQLGAGFAPTDEPTEFRWTRQGLPTAFDVRTETWSALVDSGP